jgi:hypothetical protein
MGLLACDPGKSPASRSSGSTCYAAKLEVAEALSEVDGKLLRRS